MLEFFRNLFDRNTFGSRRSSEWGRTRKEYLKIHPYCKVCGSTKKLRVHHLKPFHLFPELELIWSNLITLCGRKKYGINCHLFMGHLGNFRKINETCGEDADYWSEKLT